MLLTSSARHQMGPERCLHLHGVQPVYRLAHRRGAAPYVLQVHWVQKLVTMCQEGIVPTDPRDDFVCILSLQRGLLQVWSTNCTLRLALIWQYTLFSTFAYCRCSQAMLCLSYGHLADYVNCAYRTVVRWTCLPQMFQVISALCLLNLIAPCSLVRLLFMSSFCPLVAASNRINRPVRQTPTS
jgi:hypothetical protein